MCCPYDFRGLGSFLEVQSPILPECPKKGERPKKVFNRYRSTPPSKCRQRPSQKSRKLSKSGNDAGLKPIDDLMCPSTQWREQPDVLPVRLSGSGVFPQAPGLGLRRTILAPDGGNSQMCCPCDFQGLGSFLKLQAWILEVQSRC